MNWKNIFKDWSRKRWLYFIVVLALLPVWLSYSNGCSFAPGCGEAAKMGCTQMVISEVYPWGFALALGIYDALHCGYTTIAATTIHAIIYIPLAYFASRKIEELVQKIMEKKKN